MADITKRLTKSGKERVPSVTWSNTMRNQFIIAMTKVSAGSTCNNGFKSEEWTSITNDFNTRTEMSLTRQQLQNQYSSLKAGYSVYHTFVTQSGFGIDNHTKLVTGEAEALRDYFKAHPKAREYEFKPLMFYEQLYDIFEGTVATGKYALNFSSPNPVGKPVAVAAALTTPGAGVKRGFDVFEGDEDTSQADTIEIFAVLNNVTEPDSSDSDEGVPQQKNHPVKENAQPAAQAARNLKEKPVQSITRLLGNIVDNQQKVLDRLPEAIKIFDEKFFVDLSILEKINIKRFLGKDNNAEIFLMCNDVEKSGLIGQILI